MRKFLKFFSKIQSVSRLSQLANRSVANAITCPKTDNKKLKFQKKPGRTPFKQKIKSARDIICNSRFACLFKPRCAVYLKTLHRTHQTGELTLF